MFTLGEIANLIDAKLVGDESLVIDGIAPIENAQSSQLSYITDTKYQQQLRDSSAGAVIMTAKLAKDYSGNALIVDDVYLCFAKISHHFRATQSTLEDNLSQKEMDSADVDIGPNCIISKKAKLGKNCTIGANSVIQDSVVLKEGVFLHPNVTILSGCVIGKNTVISSGAIIGSEGFGNARDENKKWHSIAHLGAVVIGDNVTIGANTCIDRGTLTDTKIANGVRIDNLVHIAHNVSIGADTAIAANTGIAGSTVIGKRCMIGGMVGIVGHLNICDDVIINAKSTVDKDIGSAGVYTGFVPLMMHKQWQNVGLWLTKLDKIAKHLGIKLKHLKGK